MVGHTSRRPIHGRWCALAALSACLLSLPPRAFPAEPPLPPDFDRPAAGDPAAQASGGRGILDLDIEQLAKTDVVVRSLDMEVTSVAREKSTVGHSPAAVFVVTPEMIRRSGATSVPQVLRMVPGMDVARISTDSWAVSARGFNGRFANKLLVLIDGRTVYTPVFSGVHWDMQDVLLEDVERIEVIRGPGGTLWGANAVNGVINIITKSAQDTQGAYATAGGGTEERATDAVRYGGRFGENLSWRVYGKHYERDGGAWTNDAFGGAHDDGRQGRVGFRMDWDPGGAKSDLVTVQGEHYVGASGIADFRTQTLPPFTVPVIGDDRITGQHLLTRWTHTYDKDRDWSLQAYYDEYLRDGPTFFEMVETWDLDFQRRFPLSERQHIVWGIGFRLMQDDLRGPDPFTLTAIPGQRQTTLASGFVQDEVTLIEDRLTWTVGTKLEDNSYTGLEVQPGTRLLWTPDRRHSIWGAISRAVRTPSRIDDDLFFTAGPPFVPGFLRVTGNRGFVSEDMIAYETGYRGQMTDKFAWDVAVFYNVYDHLRTLVYGTPYVEFVPPPPHAVLPARFGNGAGGEGYGVELGADWEVSDRWRVHGAYTFLRLHLHGDPFLDPATEGASPQHQVYLRSSWDLGRHVEFDLMARYVDDLPALDVPAYLSMDLRLGWRPTKQWELAVVGQNLLERSHREYNAELMSRAQATAVERGVYGTITWRH